MSKTPVSPPAAEVKSDAPASLVPAGAKNKRDALRALFSDEQWHPMAEVRRFGGWRYGARILEIRRGVGGPAVDVQVRRVEGTDNAFEYRAQPLPAVLVQLAARTRVTRRELGLEIETLKRKVIALEAIEKDHATVISQTANERDALRTALRYALEGADSGFRHDWRKQSPGQCLVCDRLRAAALMLERKAGG